jgi:hypothetical protein
MRFSFHLIVGDRHKAARANKDCKKKKKKRPTFQDDRKNKRLI